MVFALYMGHIICPINMITLFVARDEKYESKKSASSSTHMVLALYMEDIICPKNMIALFFARGEKYLKCHTV